MPGAPEEDPMKQLENRVAVVTGGASGIGKGLATRFAANGMKVVLADVEAKPLHEAADALKKTGASVAAVVCDVSKADAVENLAREAYDAFGAVHVLCNNAGVAGSETAKATWECSLQEWDWMMGVNVMGVVHGIRSFLPKMIAQGDEGHVVNTASMAGLIHGSGIYGLTKHAVVALSESLSNELMMRGAKVRCSVLCPGWVSTRIIESVRNRPEAPREAPGPLAPQVEMMRTVVRQLIANGLDPNAVGDIVIDAIRNERFYVLTHPTWKNMIEARMQNILSGRDPIGVPPPDAGSWFPPPPEPAK
jgi:NAD(P)-dependent dehydrogenase (short-subunit alcohol dehydrogenase family)